MRGSHRRTTGSRITTVAGIIGRARVGTWSSDVWFCPVASVNCYRAAAAEAGNRIGAGNQSPNGVGCLVERRRASLPASVDTATTGTVISRRYDHLNPSSFLSFHCGPQFISGSATFRRRATPGVVRNIGGFCRVAFVWRAIERVRREEKFHALDVARRGAGALIHVPTTDPFRPWGHAYLVRAAIIAHRCCDGMSSMEEIIARFG